MRRGFPVTSLSLALGLLMGCANTGEVVTSVTTSSDAPVFREVTPGTPPEPGCVDLTIKSSLKTHPARSTSTEDDHGTRRYVLLVKIDGQATALHAITSEEKSGALSVNTPEDGEGTRYRFDKKIRLKPGRHKIAVALPTDHLMAERELLLSGHADNQLVIEPVYGSIPGRQKPGYLRKTGFGEGIKGMRLLLNGRTI